MIENCSKKKQISMSVRNQNDNAFAICVQNMQICHIQSQTHKITNKYECTRTAANASYQQHTCTSTTN